MFSKSLLCPSSSWLREQGVRVASDFADMRILRNCSNLFIRRRDRGFFYKKGLKSHDNVLWTCPHLFIVVHCKNKYLSSFLGHLWQALRYVIKSRRVISYSTYSNVLYTVLYTVCIMALPAGTSWCSLSSEVGGRLEPRPELPHSEPVTFRLLPSVTTSSGDLESPKINKASCSHIFHNFFHKRCWKRIIESKIVTLLRFANVVSTF